MQGNREGTGTMMKIRRQAKILELINQYDIETQDELAGHLREEGFKATQATISRDIRELKLMKVSVGGGHQKYTAVEAGSEKLVEKYLRVLRDGFVDMDMAGSLIVIRTVSGMAMAVAAALDAMNWSEVAGCIAGDDTIFCAVHTQDEAVSIMEKIRSNIS
jgi:transcriptional regulator of arginine metabolism